MHQIFTAFTLNSLFPPITPANVMSLQAELRFSLLKETEDDLGSVELGD